MKQKPEVAYPVSVADNRVDFLNTGSFNGGGFYATGANTLIFISSGLIYENETSGHGGGIAVEDQASLIIKRLEADCWETKCNLFLSNKSGLTGTGGAIYNESAHVDISASYFELNRADLATAIYTIGSGSSTRIEGSIFDRNGNNGLADFLDSYVIRSHTNSSTEIIHSTFADNKSVNAVIGISSSASSFDFYTSIVDDISVGNVLVSNPVGVINIDCIIAHEIRFITSVTHILIY